MRRAARTVAVGAAALLVAAGCTPVTPSKAGPPTVRSTSPSPDTTAAARAEARRGPLPGMPRVVDPNNIYAADAPGQLSPVVRGFPSLLYVPNSGGNPA